MTNQSQLPEIHIGDCITYQRQLNGDWWNLQDERTYSDEQVQTWFPQELEQQCTCVEAPDRQGVLCPYCAAIACRVYGGEDGELPYKKEG